MPVLSTILPLYKNPGFCIIEKIMPEYFLIDFDSTFITGETLDILAETVLSNHPHKATLQQKIKEITRQGMDGTLSFDKSLQKRFRLLAPKKEHLTRLTPQLKKMISPSVKHNKAFFKKNSSRIYIISGGFREIISQIVKDYGIHEDHILANTFLYDTKGEIIGYDHKNPLAGISGKVKTVQKLGLQGNITVIGDGFTDYELRKLGVANHFVAFTENVYREKVASYADEVASSFDEYLYNNKLTKTYPKSKIQVVLLENIDNLAVTLFENEGYQVSYFEKSLPEDTLLKETKNAHILGIRSRTMMTQEIFAKSQRLLSLGAYCIGTNQIDLPAAASQGVAVFNAPYSNTRSVVELVIGEIIMLIRGIPQKNKEMHEGIWNKSAKGQNEVRGKTIGIIGYGNIGSQLSVVAEALGMQVLFYDKVEKLALGNAKRCRSLSELLAKSDVITVHVDGSPDNKNLIAEKEFRLMKEDVIFLNLSRGFVVDVKTLAKFLRSGKLRGAAVDVFPKEPKGRDEPFISELQHLPNVILTPHIGGSTKEAQYNIAEYVTGKIISYLNTGNSFLSVNLPQIQLASQKRSHRLLHIHQNTPGMLAAINAALAANNCNILGQYLKTNEEIGYVITDIDKKYNQDILKTLSKIQGTIRFRVLY